MKIRVPVIVIAAGQRHEVRFLAAAFRGTHCYGENREEALEAAQKHLGMVLKLYRAPGAHPLLLGGNTPKAGLAPDESGEVTEIVVEFADHLPVPDKAPDKNAEIGTTETEAGYGDGIKSVRERHPRAYKPWNKAEAERLRDLHGQGLSVKQISKELQRQPGGVRSRLKKMGLT